MNNEINNDRNYTVYMHTSPSGKRYIGITKMKPEHRWNNGKGYQNNQYFYRAILKYGWENFNHEILYSKLTKDEAESKEIELIDKYLSTDINYGYNIKAGGNCKGVYAEETKIKISEKAKDRLSIKENNPMFGKTHTDEVRKIISETHEIPVSQYSSGGELICSYSSAKNASVKIGICYANISACCRNKQKTAGGYIWRYKNDKITDEYIKWCNRRETSKNVSRDGLCVSQYDLNGVFIKTYASMRAAERETGILNITACCKRKVKTVGGYIWRYADDKVTDEDLIWCNNSVHLSARKSVCQYTMDEIFIKQYDSIMDASNITGVDASAISKCCKGKYKHTGGYIWRYADEH